MKKRLPWGGTWPLSSRYRVTGDRDVVWELKYWGLRTLNKDKFDFLFNTMNEKYLPLMYSFVFCRVFIFLVDFRLLQVTQWSLKSTKTMKTTVSFQCYTFIFEGFIVDGSCPVFLNCHWCHCLSKGKMGHILYKTLREFFRCLWDHRLGPDSTHTVSTSVWTPRHHVPPSDQRGLRLLWHYLYRHAREFPGVRELLVPPVYPGCRGVLEDLESGMLQYTCCQSAFSTNKIECRIISEQNANLCEI